MFIVRRIMVLAAFFLALLLGGSYVLESFAEGQLSNGVAKTLGLPTRPAVQIDAFPILVRVVQGRIPGVLIQARDLTIEGLEITELSIDMRGVRADLDVLIRSDRFDLSAEEGEGAARISEDAINAFMKREKVNARATLRPDGTVFVRADRAVAGRTRRFEATGKLVVGGRNLSFKPSRVTVDGAAGSRSLAARARRETAFSVVIPKLPGNVLPSEVVVTKGEVSLVADLKGYELKLA